MSFEPKFLDLVHADSDAPSPAVSPMGEEGDHALLLHTLADKAKFEALFQGQIFAGILDLDGSLREINDLAVASCGFAREQVLNRPFWETPWWRGSDDVRAKVRHAARAAASGRAFREELPYWTAAGEERSIDLAVHPIRNQTSAVAFLHFTGVDITQRKQTEAALRESEQRLRYLASILESSDDAIISKSLDGIITSWNKGAERVFGFTAEEAIGQPITIIIPDDRLDEERGILSRLRRGERIDHFETVRRRKHGSFINVSITVSPVKDAHGKIVGASKFARDITQQKRHQEQIASLAHEAEHRSKNLLAVVQATVNLSEADTADGLKQAIEGRIKALANVNSLFVQSRWIGAELSALATQELAPYTQQGTERVRITGPEIMLEPNAGQTIAVALHELATNAVKYGAFSVPEGRVEIEWSVKPDGTLTLRWREIGGPLVAKPTRQGFGGRVIDRIIRQMQGKAVFDWRPQGLVCEITLRA